jgi:Tfp pilus assembly protein PilN
MRDMPRRVNLVPQSERARTATDFATLALVAVAVIAIFGVVFAYFMLGGQLDTKKQELADTQREVAQLQEQVRALDEFGRLSAQRERTEAVVQKIYAGRTLVANILDSLSLVVPEDVWFQSLDVQTSDAGLVPTKGGAAGSAAEQAGTLTIQGDTYGFDGVARVLVRLKLLTQLSDVHLVSAGDPIGQVDPTKGVRGFTVGSSVINDQPADTPLPSSQPEVMNP